MAEQALVKSSKRKYDWDEVRRQYIEGVPDDDGAIVWPTNKVLAEKNSVPQPQMENRASRERWADHRRAHQNRIALDRQKMLSKSLAKKQVVFAEQAANDSMQVKASLGKRFAQLDALYEADQARIAGLVQRVENGEKVTPALRGELKSLVSPSEYESLMKAYALADEVGRRALGMKDEETGTTIEINQQFNTSVVPSQVLKSIDRSDAIMQVLQNPNLVLGSKKPAQDELEASDEAVEAEIVEDE